ncbi:hypothetical protein SAMN02745121_04393 [Nannocystis exedens]|uniref:Uncharacterized protein n=1 Tax=Nannocystis exedens TaxID=54 RepID=A0A1I2AUT9_9BACT|nr:hypothetical protein [Nannocystis exedens]PCC74292.1 hypothetical protein NAEX_07381 [Nannocystis exedens]SFE47765.1 hypothetical protein SAMN02745121_04393 [Nannocystis exedens]
MALSARSRQILGVLVAALVGVVLVLAGLDRADFRCDRAAATCSHSAGLWGFERTRDIPLDAIVDHRFDGHDSRAGRRGVTVLIDASGRELPVGLADEATARAHYDDLHAFFQGQRSAVAVTTGPTWWLVVFGLVVLVASPWLVRPSGPARAAAPVDTATRRGASAPVIALVVGVLVLLGMSASILTSRTQGSLALRCTQRCDVGGGSCMPGSEMVLTLAPGEHEVRVFNPDEPASPIVHRVAVVRGQVTHFECAR